MTKKIRSIALAVLQLCAPLYAVAATYDPQTESGSYRLLNNGASVIVVQSPDTVQDGDSLGVYSVAGGSYTVVFTTRGPVGINQTNPRAALDMGDQSGIGLGFFTSAQLLTRTPPNGRELVWNTTTGIPCITTGTAAGQYAALISTSAGGPSTQVSRSCE